MVDQGFKEELEDAGVSLVGFGPDYTTILPNTITREKIKQIPLDKDVRAVMVGLDPWFCVTKLFKAASYLSNPKCLFLTTDISKSAELAPGYLMPGSGSLAASVAQAGKRTNPIVCGKPSNHMIDLIKQENLGVNPQRTIIIGDKISTDIKFAKLNGLSSILVMTGCTGQKELSDLVDKILPKREFPDALKKKPPRFACCDKGDAPVDPRCQCTPTFLLPSLGDLGVWGAPPPKEEETCQCYVPKVKSHDVC